MANKETGFPKEYQDMVSLLLQADNQEILDYIRRNAAMFDINLYSSLMIYVSQFGHTPKTLVNIQRIINLTLETITHNTIKLYLHHRDKEVREQIATQGWDLLNNAHAVRCWQNLLQGANNEQEETALHKFIALAKSKLVDRFMAEKNPPKLLDYLSKYRSHLLNRETIEHAVHYASGKALAVELLQWGMTLVKRSTTISTENIDLIVLCLDTTIKMLKADTGNNDDYLSLSYEYLGTAWSKLKTVETDAAARQAITYYDQAMALFSEDNRQTRYGHLLMLKGIAYSQQTKPDKSSNIENAIDTLLEAEQCSDADNGMLFLNLGNVYLQRFIGNQQHSFSKAISYYKRAITSLNDAFYLGMGYNNIGVAYKLLRPVTDETIKMAFDSFQAALGVRSQRSFPYEWAETNHNVGSLFALHPENDLLTFSDAVNSFNQALIIRNQTEYPYDWAGTQHELAGAYGTAFLGRGDNSLLAKAIASYDNALLFRTPEEHPYDAITTASKVGMLLHGQAKYSDSITYFLIAEKAYDLLNEGATNLTTKHKLVEAYDYIFKFMVNCFLQTDQLAEAFKFCVKLKGSLSAERIYGFGIRDTASLEVAFKLSEEWKRILLLTQEIQIKQDTINAFGRHTNQMPAGLRRELGALLFERKLYIEKFSYLYPLQANSQLFYSLNQQATSKLCEELSCTVIEYYQNSDQWVAFVITSTYLGGFALSETCSSVITDTVSWFRQVKTAEFAGFDELKEKALLTQLYHCFIFPFVHLLKTETKIVLSPQGDLHHVPLHLSLNPESGRMLFESYEVVNIPSLNSLNALHRQWAKNGLKYRKGKKVMLTYHPGKVKPLEYVQEEVDAIIEVFERPTILNETNSTVKNIVEAAQREDFSICHFICHAQFNQNEPAMSGLQLKESLSVETILYELRLSNMPLVCLSACETSFSGISAGDELTGLSQAFLQSGASVVVGSLWLVNDKSTSLLFSHFYRRLRDGLNVRLALRYAMQQVRLENSLKSAFYWGAFQIIGYPL